MIRRYASSVHLLSGYHRTKSRLLTERRHSSGEEECRTVINTESRVLLSLRIPFYVIIPFPQLGFFNLAGRIARYITEQGVPTFKFFMNNRGGEGKRLGLPDIDDGAFFKLFELAAQHGGMVCPHPENIEIAWVLRDRTMRADPEGRGGLAAWNATRPPFVEAEAVRKGIGLTGSAATVGGTLASAAGVTGWPVVATAVSAGATTYTLGSAIRDYYQGLDLAGRRQLMRTMLGNASFLKGVVDQQAQAASVAYNQAADQLDKADAHAASLRTRISEGSRGEVAP